jgi:Asp-tRNA(Asn)/Glu-tRNA(Gln) amidotransferase C subunit
MALLRLIKNKLIFAGAVLIAVLLGTIRFLSVSRKQHKEKADQLEAILERQEEINELDSELSSDLQSHKAEIKKELKQDEEITSLSDPDNWD